MRPTKKAQRRTDKAVAGLKDFLIAMGQDPDAVEKALDSTSLHVDEKMLQAEGVLLHLVKPTRFISKTCKRPECGEVFGTSYRSVAYCSDNCRAKHLESQTGIRWNPHVDRYRNLDGERPLVIGPQAYQTLIEFAKYILAENHIEVQQTDQTLPEVPQLPHQSQEELPALSSFDEQSLTELSSQLTNVLDTSPDVLPQQSEQPESSPDLPKFDLENPFGF